MRQNLIAIIALLLALISPASAIDYRWTQGFGQGTLEAIIRNRSGSSLNIYCPSGAAETTPGLIVETKLVKPKRGKMLYIQIVVDGENYPFNIDERMMYLAAGRGFLNNLVSLVEALKKSRAENFVVEYPQVGKSEFFALTGAKKALGDGKQSILDGCM